ncbi:hypothetical protein ACQKTA_13155 (plasmid) [Enterococcus sp. 22-H-5-01]|uniref:hypothetical protein n=1 Tax=Enterococcus sp. 22-H-5-01 TaxID=3418555 RepID=UPI003CFFD70B
MRKSISNNLFKQIYYEGIHSFWYFPTLFLISFITGLIGLSNLFSRVLFDSVSQLNPATLFFVYEGSILLTIPFLMYLFRRVFIKKRTRRYEQKLMIMIAHYNLTIPAIDTLQTEIGLVLKNQTEKRKLNALLVKLAIIPVVFIFLQKYVVLSIAFWITPLIVIALLFLLNYFTSYEWLNNLRGITSKQAHQLTFVESELAYMKVLINHSCLVEDVFISEREQANPDKSLENIDQLSMKDRIVQHFFNFVDSKEDESFDEEIRLKQEELKEERKNRFLEEATIVVEENVEDSFIDSTEEEKNFSASDVESENTNEAEYTTEETAFPEDLFNENEIETVDPEELSEIINEMKFEKIDG